MPIRLEEKLKIFYQKENDEKSFTTSLTHRAYFDWDGLIISGTVSCLQVKNGIRYIYFSATLGTIYLESQHGVRFLSFIWQYARTVGNKSEVNSNVADFEWEKITKLSGGKRPLFTKT